MVALLIAYLPTLYGAVNRREMLVTLLESRAGAPSVGADDLNLVGFPLERTAAEAWADFRGWRVDDEELAYELADRIVAVPALWSGPRGHVPGAAISPDRPAHRAADGRK